MRSKAFGIVIIIPRSMFGQMVMVFGRSRKLLGPRHIHLANERQRDGGFVTAAPQVSSVPGFD
jgi:hypothetical protein